MKLTETKPGRLEAKWADRTLMYTLDETIVLKTGIGAYEYGIENSRMDTPEKLLGWIEHLSKKNWFTRFHCQALILYARNLNVNVRNPSTT